MDIYIHDQQDDESISQANKWIQPTKVGICPRNSEFPISYMGCHPKPIDEVHHFSRWLKPHHQPVEFMNHFVSAGLTFNLDTPRPIQETFSPWLWHMTRDMLRCSSTIFFLSEFFQVDEQANELVQRWE
jgi:hypothetical protein